MTCDGKTALCTIVHRAAKMESFGGYGSLKVIGSDRMHVTSYLHLIETMGESRILT